MTLCRFCKSDIPSDATRCPHCTSFLDGEQPQVSQGQVVYILDKGLVTFGKFGALFLAIFAGVGLYIYGIDIKEIGKEIEKESREIKDTLLEIQKVAFNIKKAESEMKQAESELAEKTAAVKKGVASAEAAAKVATNTSSRAKMLLDEAEKEAGQIHGIAITLVRLARGSRQIISLRRQVFNANNTMDLPGELVRKEGDASTKDPVANEAYDNLGTVYRFFEEVFNRESVDNHGKMLVATIHYGEHYDNAFWDGKQMVYGDGDGVIFQRFTAALDVTTAELTHGVTQFTAQLAFHDQPGALNMSMSYVFGSMVKQWALGQTVDQADWLFGATIMAQGFKGKALGDMANPGTAYDDPHLGKDPQPGHMKDYVHTKEDNGGVHINSGIPNRAFVLAAKAIGGHSWEKTGKIWYVTLTERLTGESDFAKCAAETVSVARELYPDDPSIAKKVEEAWKEVGVLKKGSMLSGKP